MSDFQPWQQAFIITGLPGVLMALMIFLFPEPPRHHIRKVTDSTGYGDALRFIGSHRRLFVGIFIGFGLVYTCTISLQLWLPSYFVRVHGWTPGRIGIVLGIAQISAALSLPVHGWIVDRFYQRGMRDAHLYWCILSVCLAGPCAVAALLIPNPWMTVILFALYMMFVLSSASMGPAVTQVVTPQHLRGRVSAIYVLTTGLIAMSVGPAAVGFFTDKIFGDPRGRPVADRCHIGRVDPGHPAFRMAAARCVACYNQRRLHRDHRTSSRLSQWAAKQLLIDGKFVDAISGERFIARNSATGEELAQLALAGPEDVDRAVAICACCFQG